MSDIETVPPVYSSAPEGDRITPYDRAHMATYLLLLHAAGEGLSPDEMAREALGLNPGIEQDRARMIVENHLARARWLATSGHKLLLESETDTVS